MDSSRHTTEIEREKLYSLLKDIRQEILALESAEANRESPSSQPPAPLELDLYSKLPQVPCYLDDINQVLLNIVVNSAQTIAAGQALGRDFILLTIQ